MWYGQFGYGGILMMVLAVIVIAVVIYLVVRSNGTVDRHSSYPPEESPLDILRRRYANGEINQEDYEHMKKILRS
jgi:putative membrane protein